LDEAAVDALVSEITRGFVRGLQELVAQANAELDTRRKQLRTEALDLEASRERLRSDAANLDKERAVLNRERGLLGVSAGEQNDMVSLNLGGEVRMAVLRSTLTQCDDSMLAAAFSGRWELPRDEDGHVFVNFAPSLFMPLVQHLRMRQIEDPEDPTPPPTLETPELEASFRRMLKYYGLEEWIYRTSLPEKMQHQLHIKDYTYAVLPLQSPYETVALGDMSNQVVAVPRGWEVLQTDVEGFDDIMRELANHGWGALRLCCQNPGGTFSSYLTKLHGGGTAGMCWSGDARLLHSLSGTTSAFSSPTAAAASGQQFRFKGDCSARLVIRVPDRPLGCGQLASRGEGRRLAAI